MATGAGPDDVFKIELRADLTAWEKDIARAATIAAQAMSRAQRLYPGGMNPADRAYSPTLPPTPVPQVPTPPPPPPRPPQPHGPISPEAAMAGDPARRLRPRRSLVGMVGRQFEKTAMRGAMGLVGVGMAAALMDGLAEGIKSERGMVGVGLALEKQIRNLPLIGSALKLGEAMGEALLESMFGDDYDTTEEVARKAKEAQDLAQKRIRGAIEVGAVVESAAKREASHRAGILRSVGDELGASKLLHAERMRQIDRENAENALKVSGTPQEILAQTALLEQAAAAAKDQANQERALEMAEERLALAERLVKSAGSLEGIEASIAELQSVTPQQDATIRYAHEIKEATRERALAEGQINKIVDDRERKNATAIADKTKELSILQSTHDLERAMHKAQVESLSLTDKVADSEAKLLLARAAELPHLREKLELESAIAAATREREIAYATAAQEEDSARQKELEHLADLQYQTGVLAAQERDRIRMIERFRHSEGGQTAIGAFRFASALQAGGDSTEQLSMLTAAPTLPATPDVGAVEREIERLTSPVPPTGLEELGKAQGTAESIARSIREKGAEWELQAERGPATKKPTERELTQKEKEQLAWALRLKAQRDQEWEREEERFGIRGFSGKTLDEQIENIELLQTRSNPETGEMLAAPGSELGNQLDALRRKKRTERANSGDRTPDKGYFPRDYEYEPGVVGPQAMLPSFLDTEKFLRANPNKQVGFGGLGGGKFDPRLGWDGFGEWMRPAATPRFNPTGGGRGAFNPAEFLRGIQRDPGEYMTGLGSGGAPSIGSIGGDPQMARLLDVMTEVASHLRAQAS